MWIIAQIVETADFQNINEVDILATGHVFLQDIVREFCLISGT